MTMSLDRYFKGSLDKIYNFNELPDTRLDSAFVHWQTYQSRRR